MPFDVPFLDYLQTLRSDFLDAFMRMVTALGNGGIFWIILTAALIIIPKTRRAGISAGLSLALEFVICNLILKNAVARIRPFELDPSVELLITPPADFSFPSGHAGASFAVTSGLLFGGSRLWLPAAFLSVLISFSRLYLYVHYPTDVIAGAVLGIMTGLVSAIAVSAIYKKLILPPPREKIPEGRQPDD